MVTTWPGGGLKQFSDAMQIARQRAARVKISDRDLDALFRKSVRVTQATRAEPEPDLREIALADLARAAAPSTQGMSMAPKRPGEPLPGPTAPALAPWAVAALRHLDELPDTPGNRDARARLLKPVLNPTPRLPTPRHGVAADEPPAIIPALQRAPLWPRAPVPPVPRPIKGETDGIGRGVVAAGGYKVV
jgi:hypothetical protein